MRIEFNTYTEVPCIFRGEKIQGNFTHNISAKLLEYYDKTDLDDVMEAQKIDFNITTIVNEDDKDEELFRISLELNIRQAVNLKSILEAFITNYQKEA